MLRQNLLQPTEVFAYGASDAETMMGLAQVALR